MPAPDRPAAPLPGSLYQASARPTPGGAQGIEELLRERLKLDDLLQQQFRRDITLLFTDIQDSTAYFERYGDDALVQIPWELLFDGQHFLCRRFSMGRLVSTPQALVERQECRPEQLATGRDWPIWPRW